MVLIVSFQSADEIDDFVFQIVRQKRVATIVVLNEELSNLLVLGKHQHLGA